MKLFCKNLFSIKTLTMLVCYGIVFWQIFECFKKYLERPHGTDLKIIAPRAKSLPLFTICTNERPRYNEQILKSCGIQGERDYYNKNKWIGNCSDPEDLYEKIVKGKGDIVKTMKPNNFFGLHKKVGGQTEQITLIDRFAYGKCIMLRMTDAYISSYKFEFKTKVKIYFHSFGSMKSSRPRVYFRIDPDERMTVALEYSINEFLDSSKEPCEKNIDYNTDDCIDKALYEKSIKEIGCTTPWGKNKTMICTEQSKADMAVDLYNTYFMGENHSCPKACTISRIRGSVLYYNKNSTARNNSVMYINLAEKVSDYKSYFTYTGLSLVAEIGGYVGLFLGISVNQFYKMIGAIKTRLRSLVTISPKSRTSRKILV